MLPVSSPRCRESLAAGERVEVIVLDPKAVGEFSWCRSFVNRKVMVTPPAFEGVPRDLLPGPCVGGERGCRYPAPDSEHLGTYGSTLLANLGARIGVGGLEPSGAGALFGKGNGETIAARLKARVPGRFFYQGLSGGEGGDGLVLGHGWWATDELVAAL
jgi:hypothetical protein